LVVAALVSALEERMMLVMERRAEKGKEMTVPLSTT
jgi:hypothetical protein